jgi:hypothetical protein
LLNAREQRAKEHEQMRTLMKPADLAVLPNVEQFAQVAYDWEKQGRVGPLWCGTRQTFDYKGQPNDSTSGSGSTQQTFDYKGTPNDAKSD